MPEAPDQLIGRDISGYKVLSLLGRGAMGTVYLAEQISLGRKIALKVLDSRFSRDATYIDRFEREARAAASLAHYNVVQVFSFGRDEKADLFYIANEFVDGGTVQQKIDRDGSIAPDMAVEMILQACRGMEAASAQGLVHRDIKPENLMLTSAGAIKIADFGLAKSSADVDAAATQAGMIVGTPYYMSPEQAKGLPLDTRSDQYSLGVSFFHMVTGQIPFDADSVIGVLLKQISAERPDPVSINPAVPAPVGAVIKRMMSRDAAQRYQTPTELVRELTALQLQLHQQPAAPAPLPLTPSCNGEGASASGRRSRYKKLRSSQVLRVALRKVPPAMKQKMLAALGEDAGVFLEGQSFAENEILDVYFQIPGRKGYFAAIGVVRKNVRSDVGGGVGVTFLTVSEVSQVPGKVEAPRPQMNAIAKSLKPEEIIQILTRSPLHCRLLRYYYANVNQTIEVRQVAGALGVAVRLLQDPLRDLVKLGLARQETQNDVSFFWPERDQLQQKLIDWISEYGLRS